jgi:hypothetical protein
MNTQIYRKDGFGRRWMDSQARMIPSFLQKPPFFISSLQKNVQFFSDFPHFPIDYRVCLTFEMLATGFSHAAFLAVYFISLERLLIVMMPMRSATY